MIDLSKLAEPGSIEESLLERIDFKRMPRHIAVIMDGNGRWAKSRNLPRVEGHRAGITSVREIVETAARLELRVITLYAFSVENWKRPRYEVATLMLLLKGIHNGWFIFVDSRQNKMVFVVSMVVKHIGYKCYPFDSSLHFCRIAEICLLEKNRSFIQQCS